MWPVVRECVQPSPATVPWKCRARATQKSPVGADAYLTGAPAKPPFGFVGRADYLTTCALGREIVRVEGLDDLLSELKAQGRNLNQLTTLANMRRITVLRGDDLLNEYTRLCDTLSALVREVR